jgi:IS30 family transposase
MAKASEIEALLAKCVNPHELARRLGIERSNVYRAMRERRIKRQPVVYRPATWASGATEKGRGRTVPEKTTVPHEG